jgi:hypothetical protein
VHTRFHPCSNENHSPGSCLITCPPSKAWFQVWTISHASTPHLAFPASRCPSTQPLLHLHLQEAHNLHSTPTLLFFSRYPSLHGPSLHFLEHSPHPPPTRLASSILPLPIKRAEGRREDYSHGGSQGRWRGFPVHALGVRGAGVPTLWFS